MRAEDAVRGAKVRCVDDYFMPRSTDPFRNNSQLSLPRRDRIYTVRERVETEENDGVLLLEIQNRTFDYDIGGTNEVCFSLDRFELVDPAPMRR